MNGSETQADPHGLGPDDSRQIEVERALTAQAVHNLLDAVDSGADFAAWVARVLATVASVKGSSYELFAANPDSIESACLQHLVRQRVGDDDQHLAAWRPLPVTGVELSIDGGTLFLTTMIWGQQATSVYVQTEPLGLAGSFRADVHTWLEDLQDPATTGGWQLTRLNPTKKGNRTWLAYAVRDLTLRVQLAPDLADVEPRLRHYLNPPQALMAVRQPTHTAPCHEIRYQEQVIDPVDHVIDQDHPDRGRKTV